MQRKEAFKDISFPLPKAPSKTTPSYYTRDSFGGQSKRNSQALYHQTYPSSSSDFPFDRSILSTSAPFPWLPFWSQTNVLSKQGAPDDAIRSQGTALTHRPFSADRSCPNHSVRVIYSPFLSSSSALLIAAAFCQALCPWVPCAGRLYAAAGDRG